MTSKLFIVYRITNVACNKHYYGYKSCGNVDPKQILGKTYFSSSSNKEFIREQKEHPERFKYKVVAKFNTRKEAMIYECRLHSRFDVAHNDTFYNIAQSTRMSFFIDPTGKVFVTKDNTSKLIDASELDEFISNGWSRGLRRINKTRRVAINNGIIEQIIPLDQLDVMLCSGWVRGRLCAPNKGKVRVHNNTEEILVSVDSLSDYTNMGYKKGRRKMSGESTSGQMRITKDGKNTTIPATDLEKFLNDGWVRGITRRSVADAGFNF